jgi:iron complex outermembrane receptor protein
VPWWPSAVVVLGLGLIVAELARAQEPTRPPADKQATQNEKKEGDTSPREVGGRLVVSGETVLVVADPDAVPRDASIATKTDTPLLETPRSVSVTDRRTLDDRLATNVEDAHDYTVGMIPEDERGPGYARGFRVGFYDLRRDGLRTYSWSVREPVALDRVQYLRGPAAVLYGDGSSGGLVNLVLKKPLPVRRAEVTASGGELGFGRLTADVTGPVTASRRVRYRVIGAVERLDNGFDNNERRVSFLPMLSFDVGTRVTVHVDGEWYDQRGRGYRHTVPSTPDTQHGDFSRIPWDLNVASPDDRWSGWSASPGVRLDARLGQRSSVHTSARYTRIGGDLDIQGLAALSGDGRTLLRYAYREVSSWQEYQSDTFVISTVDTGAIEHRLVTGLEAGLSTTDSEIGIGSAPSLDMYAPVYAARPPAPALRPSRYDVLRLGAYAQDQIRVRPSIIVVPALRWSGLHTTDRAVSTAPDSGNERTASDVALLPSLGVVVLPRPWLSVYSTAARGFEPPTPGQYLEDGRAVVPADNSSIEAGVKADVPGSRLALTGAVYGIRRTNVPEAVTGGFYRQIGEGKSRGIEAGLHGGLVRGLDIDAGYAWTRTEITRDVAGVIGRELPNAPRHKANVWVRYRFPEGRLRHVTLATGVVHVSNRFVAGDNVIIAPAYTRLDASGSYELAGARLKLSAGVQNVANTRYVTSGAGAALYAGAPRRVAFQITSSF